MAKKFRCAGSLCITSYGGLWGGTWRWASKWNCGKFWLHFGGSGVAFHIFQAAIGKQSTLKGVDIDTSPDNRKIFLLCAKGCDRRSNTHVQRCFCCSLTQMFVAWSKESVTTEIIQPSFWAIWWMQHRWKKEEKWWGTTLHWITCEHHGYCGRPIHPKSRCGVSFVVR